MSTPRVFTPLRLRGACIMVANNEARRQSILLLVFVLLLAGIVFIWYYFLRTDTNVVVELLQPTPETDLISQNEDARALLGAFDALSRIKLDTEIFSDPRFTDLQKTPLDIPVLNPPSRSTFPFALPERAPGRR